MTDYEELARASAKARRERIILIPDECQVDERHLHSLTNEEFVRAFKELQQLVCRIYEKIEQAPFLWGYPEQNDSMNIDALAYERLVELFFALLSNGEYRAYQVSINRKQFKRTSKSHKQLDKMIDGLRSFGFDFENYGQESETFTLTYPPYPALLEVLFIYCNLRSPEQRPWGDYYSSYRRFSHRWIEDPGTQPHEMLFHAKMDECSEALRQIQEWLYEEASQYGYKIDETHPYEKGCIAYKKGSKTFLLVGEWRMDGGSVVFSKVIFRDVFTKENAKMQELYKKFPSTFRSNCTHCNGSKPDGKCTMRICYEMDGEPHRNCAYQSFYFVNPTLDDLKSVLKLFLTEKKIKRLG